MKSKENIVFLGMMGSGKSSVGFLVSKKLNFEFNDTDKIIENELKLSIAEIFKIKGENFFQRNGRKNNFKNIKKKEL